MPDKEMNKNMTNTGLTDKLKNNRLLADLLVPGSFRQLARYLVTGFGSAAIELSLLYIFKDILKLPVIAANSAALSIVFWFNFLVNRLWSFRSRSDIRKQLLMYAVLFIFNLGVSDLIMYVLTSGLTLHYLVAKVFAIGAVVCWNFILYKKVIYK